MSSVLERWTHARSYRSLNDHGLGYLRDSDEHCKVQGSTRGVTVQDGETGILQHRTCALRRFAHGVCNLRHPSNFEVCSLTLGNLTCWHDYEGQAEWEKETCLPKDLRGRWNSIQSLSGFTWSGSAALGAVRRCADRAGP